MARQLRPVWTNHTAKTTWPTESTRVRSCYTRAFLLTSLFLYNIPQNVADFPRLRGDVPYTRLPWANLKMLCREDAVTVASSKSSRVGTTQRRTKVIRKLGLISALQSWNLSQSHTPD